MKLTCSKMVKKGPMTQERPCFRKNNHSGGCTPDLTGMKIGNLLIKKLGPKDRWGQVTWTVEADGIERIIGAYNILSGNTTGKRSRSGYASRNGKVRPEYSTVFSHHRAIFISEEEKHRNYKEMPFCDEWNPDKGGSFQKGTKWIIDNLGEKPGPEWSIDIIKHEEGFVPGNLRWAMRSVQMKNQRRHALGQWSEEEFAVEARRRGYVKINDTFIA